MSHTKEDEERENFCTFNDCYVLMKKEMDNHHTPSLSKLKQLVKAMSQALKGISA